MASKSALSRTNELLKAMGYTYQKVEHWNPFAHIRQDLFGCIDVLAIKKNECLGVQVKSSQLSSEDFRKYCSEDSKLKGWLDAGNTYEIHCWRKLKKSINRKFWQVRRLRVDYTEATDWSVKELKHDKWIPYPIDIPST